MKTPVPEWTKQILAPAEKAEASETVPEPELVEHVLEESREERETDIPEDVQNEIRALAAAEDETMAAEAPPEDISEETFEEVSPEGELEAEEGAPEAEAEAPSEPEEPPKPPRTPRRFEFLFRAGPLRRS